MTTTPSDDPRPDRLRELFEQVQSQPIDEIEAFLRGGADSELADEVLAMLRNANLFDATTVHIPPKPGSKDIGAAGQKVQSTATDELLARLDHSPRLDTQRYALEGEVDRGGMGAILKIHDRQLNRRLAMKVLLDREPPRDDYERQLAHQLLGRFLEEAQVTSQLDHPGVVPVHELGLDQAGKVFFTMRLVKGRTAGEVFAQAHSGNNEWTTTRALEVVLKVCDTMAFAHEKGILDRDLKPDNVMVGRFGEVYVMDWGLAKVLGQPDRHDVRIRPERPSAPSYVDSVRRRDADSDDGASVVSMDGQKLGTPSYMPPEQARSEELDTRADVYAIGAMMYELLTGRAPYTTPGLREPAYRILRDVAEGAPQPITHLNKGVPAELVAIVEKAMARDREQRYASVLELAGDVRAYVAQRVVKAYRTGALVEMKLWVRRNRPLAASLAAAMLILVAGIVSVSIYADLANQNARDNARLAQDEAAARARFEGKVQEFDRLKLVVTYERLIKDEPTLTPGWPNQGVAIDGWLDDAQRLLSRRAELDATLTALRREASDLAEDGAASASTFLANSLAGLRDNLPQLEALLPGMLQRQRWAQVIGPATLAHPNAKVSWAEARAAIAKADGVVASTLYAGQDIALQDDDVWGLVPIGMNAESKLWEFYDLRSAWDGVQDPAALRIPEYGADGRLTINGETGIVFVLLPGGTLPPGTKDVGSDTSVRLNVRLDPFFLGKYEVTQGQWLRWTGKTPSYSKTESNLALPVEQVSWFDVDPVLRAEGLVLPSELQWEYGIRAGTTTLWWTGDTEASVKAKENISTRKLLPVGSKAANPFGLFDMGGNLWESCFDEYSAYGTERAGDGRRPDPPDGSSSRCGRGGGFDDDPDIAHSEIRFSYSPSIRISNLGLRAARTSRL